MRLPLTLFGSLILTWIKLVTLTDALTVDVPDEVEVDELSPVSVKCLATHDNPGLTIYLRWIKMGDPSFQRDGAYLNFSRVMAAQAGVYICEAAVQEDPPVHVRKNLTLFVNYRPRWDDEALDKFAARIGDSADIECRIHGYPAPTFLWEDTSGVNMPQSSPDYIIRNGETNSSVRFYSIRADLYGKYKCIASNNGGNSVHMIALKEPGIPDVPRNCSFITCDITCIFHCYPSYLGGEEPGFAVFATQIHGNAYRLDVVVTVNGSVAILDATGLSPNTSYTVEVFAENSHGRSEDSYGMFIKVPEYPGVPPSSSFSGTLAIVISIVIVVIILIISAVISVIFYIRHRDKWKEVDSQREGMLPQREGVSSRASSGERRSLGVILEESGQWAEDDQAEACSGPSSAHVDPAHHLEHSPPHKLYTIADRNTYGYGNPAYEPDFSNNTSVYSNVPAYDSEARAEYGNIPADPSMRLPVDQPDLCGLGAMSAYAEGASPVYSNAPPLAQTSYAETQHVYSNTPPPEVPPPCSHSSAHNSSGSTTDSSQRSKKKRSSDRPVGHVSPMPQESPPHSPAQGSQTELSIDKIGFKKKIGEGSYAEVWKCKLDKKYVAVKMLKDLYSPEDKRRLLTDLRVLQSLQPHPNVISLHGWCTREEPLCVVTEFATHGSLLKVLRQQRKVFSSPENVRLKLTLRDLVIFAFHVASGMEYISSLQLLHRDLAAHSVLVDRDLVCKLSDFASPQDVAETREQQIHQLPLRWMAPESLLTSIYSMHSDVWSFGVLLWEIITLASTPYPGMGHHEVMDFVQKGGRMVKPTHCSPALYAVMLECWNQLPLRRPAFPLICQHLSAILEREDNSLGIEQMEDNMYSILSNQTSEKC